MSGRRKGTGRPTQAEGRAERLQSELAARVSITHTPIDRLAVSVDFARAVLKSGSTSDLDRAVDDLAKQLRDRCSAHLLRASTPRAPAPHSTPRSTYVSSPQRSRTA